MTFKRTPTARTNGLPPARSGRIATHDRARGHVAPLAVVLDLAEMLSRFSDNTDYMAARCPMHAAARS
jgi:hypothetical protein